MSSLSDTSKHRIAIATCHDAWRADEDAPLLLGALAAIGVDATEAVWDDPEVDWADFEMVVVRSTWDYALRRDEFLDWAERVEAVTELRNPASVIRWNTDKRYLAELAAAGVPVAPTTFLLPTDLATADLTAADLTAADLAASDGGHGGDDGGGGGDGGGGTGRDRGIRDRIAGAAPSWSERVVKPTVSAGSKDTVRYGAPDDDPSALDDATAQTVALLAAGRPVMVQPYLSAVDTLGETGLVFLGGRFSHAFRKGPLLQVGGDAVTALYAEESISPRAPSDAEMELAEQVLTTARQVVGGLAGSVGTPSELYARVDLIPTDDGSPVLLELELAEPSFFLATSEGAASRAAAAIVGALG